MFPNITIDMRLEDLGYKPMKIPDNITVKCRGAVFSEEEVSTFMDLVNMYDIKFFSVNKNYAIFYDADNEAETVFKYYEREG